MDRPTTYDKTSNARASGLTVGFIGLGVMGLPMARNLQAAGHSLIVYSRTRSRADELLADGARWRSSPAEVALESMVVITMLPDSPEVRAVVEGSEGILAGAREGLIWIDMSSIAPQAACNLAERATKAGVECLDAPVSGGEAAAIAGTLSIMVGGPRATLDRCRHVLDVLGQSVVLVGDAGSGQVAKVCNQLVVACNIAAVAEALVLAVSAGVDPVLLRQVLLGGFAQSRVLEVHGERMLKRTFEPGFRVALHRKDLVNALGAGRSSGTSLLLAATVTELMTALVANDLGDLDHSALVKIYESLAGRTLT